jgi:phosphatidylinositol-3-phosphatase
VRVPTLRVNVQTRRSILISLFAFFIFLFTTACGTSSSSGTPISSGGDPAPPSTPVPVQVSTKVLILVLENKNYNSIVDKPTMPYFNSLIPQGALATGYYANFHPSIGDYFMLTTGDDVTNDQDYQGPTSVDNIARQITKDGKTWKAYAESIPSVGYLGFGQVPYARRHVPFTYMSDITENPAQAANIVPYTELATDLSSNALPDYSFLVLNLYDQGHDCVVAGCAYEDLIKQSDDWLQQNIPTILNDPTFKTSGILVILWDEASDDTTNGGGRVPVLFLGPKVKPGFQSSNMYKHEDLLRMSCDRIGLTSCPGLASSASTMSEFFQ